MIEKTASYACWRAFLDGEGVKTPSFSYRAVLVSISMGRSWSLWENEMAPPLALYGIVHTTKEVEAWIKPARRAGARIIPLCRKIRRHLDHDARIVEPREIIVRVHDDNSSGISLVRVLGFVASAEVENKIRIWYYRRGVDG